MFKAAIDTNMNYTIVPAVDCDRCLPENTLYDYQKSNSSKLVNSLRT